jgi:dihydrofolate reductase
MISIIVAMGCNGEIGRNGKLLFRLSNDIKWFREKTDGKPIIMGRKTFESIGKPLPGRINIVITGNSSFRADGCLIARSIEEALSMTRGFPEVMVIGGGTIYRQFLPFTNRIYLTTVDASFNDANVFFPEINWQEWAIIQKDSFNADEKNKYSHFIAILEKKSRA